MSAAGPRSDLDGLSDLIIVRFWIDNWPSRFLIDALRPRHLRERLCRNERAGYPVEHVVKAVLVGLHDDFALPAVYREVGEHQLLNAVKVPGVPGHHLVVPLELSGIRLDGENRAYVEVVFAFRLAKVFRPRSAIPGSDIDQVRIGIVSHAVPDRSATAEFPPVSGPGFRGFLQGRVFKRLRRIAWNRIEPPGECAGAGVVSRKESANRIFAAGDADDDFALRDTRRHRERVVLLREGHASFSNDFSRFRLQPLEAAVNDRGNDLALIIGNAAIHHAATDLGLHGLAVDFGVPPPFFFAGPGIDGVNDAPVRDSIDGAVDH